MFGLTFANPQMLTLLLLLPLAWRRLTSGRFSPSTAARLAFFILSVFALSRPRITGAGDETDLIVLVDRSDSCESAAERMLAELLPAIRGGGAGDRFAVVGFGNGATVERGFDSDAVGRSAEEGFSRASDIAAALDLAESLRRPGRRAAVLCFSDGLYTGRDPALSSGLAALPFWYRRTVGGSGVDAAAGRIGLPDSASPQGAWLVRCEIFADSPCEGFFTLSRNGAAIAGGPIQLRRGVNRFFARDTSEDEGLLEYRLEIRAAGDRQPRNNVSRALLRVRGAPRTLIVSPDGDGGFLAGTLAAAAIPVDRAAPADMPTDAASLSPYELVVLENCPVPSLPPGAAEALASAVEAGMTSLLATGGANGFGNGGYHRSALDRVLPVDLELRNEKRRGTMAVAIVLDRSGSMSAGAGGGRSKMDLANLGAAESIRLLAPGDQAAVLAVDTAPHVVVPLSPADDAEALAGRTMGIKPMGGGIYCLTALSAAAAEIAKSELINRHIVLFADASDAEEQEGCADLARELVREGIGLSVIAMGTRGDSDAAFLADLASAGGGEILFSSRAEGLPALFTQEITRVSKRGFIEEPTRPRLLPGLAGLGVDLSAPAPRLDGFNVSSLREGATALMNLDDEFATPLLALRPAGRGMAGAVLFEIDGEHSGSFPAWRESAGLLVSLVRRLSAGRGAAGVKAYAEERGGEATARFEFSPEAADRLRGLPLRVDWLGPDGVAITGRLEWIEPGAAIAKTAFSEPGHYIALADLGESGTAISPAATFSYGDEYRPRPESEGRETLARLADMSGGGEALDITQVRRSATSENGGGTDMLRFILAGMIVLFLFELSGRRLAWFS